jgi:hypothetical protein
MRLKAVSVGPRRKPGLYVLPPDARRSDALTR